MHKYGNTEDPKQATSKGGSDAQGPPEPLPVVDEAKRDRVPGITGWRCPALGQDHLEVAFLFIEPHFDLDVVAGRHAIIPRYRGVPNKQLHFCDKISSAMEVLNDGVNPAEGAVCWRFPPEIPLIPTPPRKATSKSVEIKKRGNKTQMRTSEKGCLFRAGGSGGSVPPPD